MPRTTYIWDPETRKLIPKAEAIARGIGGYRRRNKNVMPDIVEFQTVDGVNISSRSALREYQQRTGLEQIGSDTVNPKTETGEFTTRYKELPPIEPVIHEAMQRARRG